MPSSIDSCVETWLKMAELPISLRKCHVPIIFPTRIWGHVPDCWKNKASAPDLSGTPFHHVPWSARGSHPGPKQLGKMLEVLPKNGVHWKHDKTGLGVLKCSENADKFTWANAVETPMLIFCWPSILVLCASSKGQSSAWSSSKTSAICGENWSWFVQTEGYPNLRPVHCWRLSFWKTWYFEFQNCRDKPILNLTLC